GVPSGRSTLSRTRQASSTSPQRAIPPRIAQSITGCEGGKPGEATITSGANSRSSAGTSSRGPSRSRAPMTGTSRSYSSAALSESTSTSAPSSVSVSAAEKPVTDRPRTATRSPLQSACQLVSASRRAESIASADRGLGEPVHVEESHGGCRQQARDDPQPHHDRDLRPAAHLQVVVERAHQEQPPAARDL